MESYKNSKCIGAIIRPGFYDRLVLIGYPYEEGAKKEGQRLGSAYGPDCFRRFLHKICPIKNAEYNIDLSKLGMCDYGNVVAESALERPRKLCAKVRLTMERGQTTFVIGGSRDLVPYCAEAVLEHAETKPYVEGLEKEEKKAEEGKMECHKVLFIAVTPTIEVEDKEGGVNSIWRKIISNPAFAKSGSKTVMFGTTSLCDKENFDYFTGKGGDVVWLKEIRKAKMSSGTKFVSQTQAGRVFEELINASSEKYETIYLSFNIEAVLGSQAPGVTEIHGVGGLTGEEAAEIMLAAGKCGKTRLVDLTEFNPRVEDYRTGRLATSLFYFFSLGIVMREKSQ